MRCRVIHFIFVYLLFLFLPISSLALSNDLVIVFSGDTLGSLEPCGCSPRKGGIARRAAFIEKIRKENDAVLVLDSGDLFLKKKKFGELRAKYIVKAMGIMKYDAINVGDEDLGLGVNFLSDAAKAFNLPFVSANVSIKKNEANKEESFIQPYKIINKGGVKVGVTGITPELYFKDEDVKKDITVGRDISLALRNTLAELNKQSDFTILLSHLGTEATKSFLELNDIEGVFVVIAGHGRHLTFEPILRGNKYMVQNSMTGESIGVLKVHLNSNNKPESCQLENVTLSLDMPENEEIAKMVKAYDLESSKQEEEERKSKEKADADESLKKVLKLSPNEFVEKMKQSKDGSVPLQ